MSDENNIIMASSSLMFYKTAEVLDKVIRAASEANNSQLMSLYLVPHIVNKSFAAEMAMKAILKKKGLLIPEIIAWMSCLVLFQEI